MNAAEALRFVETHGIVLESARHPRIPSLAEAVAGAPIRGSWWSHPKGKAIFAATRAMREAPEVLVCRVVDGKVSLAHERLWPALVKLAGKFPRKDLARIRETHTESGAHRVENVAFPKWVPARTTAAAERMSDADARAVLAPLLGTR
ncbi:MAG TPA: hypothetical protein VFV97_13590 [Rhodanobacteraceae bacterium]|nr:hypothetical protein [Rhodanobacteraceae bacterium]